jgi:uncharacterized membrane protein YcaP (DUF421 family)
MWNSTVSASQIAKMGKNVNSALIEMNGEMSIFCET